jgi:hypothetical protein
VDAPCSNWEHQEYKKKKRKKNKKKKSMGYNAM